MSANESEMQILNIHLSFTQKLHCYLFKELHLESNNKMAPDLYLKTAVKNNT